MKTKTTDVTAFANELGTLTTLNIDDDSMCTDTTPLSATEKNMLKFNETCIEQGKLALLEVGRSLLTIQRGKLYRGQYTSFNEYCRERWGIGRQRGYELINAAVTSEALADAGVDTSKLNERQTRPLGRLTNTQQRVSALTRAQELAGEANMTSRHVKQAVDELIGTPDPIIDVDEVLPRHTSTLTITINKPESLTKRDVIAAIDGLRDIATTLKVNDHFAKPLDRLEAMIAELVPDNTPHKN